MPLLLLANWFFGLFTLAYIIVDIYLFREWYIYRDLFPDYSRNCLIGAVALLAFITIGRFVIRLFTGKSATTTEQEPKMERSIDSTVLERADGSKIQIEYMGPIQGPVLLMLHGWGNDSTEWYYQKKQLSKKYRMVLIDLPGLGKSVPPRNGDCSVSKYSMDLQAVINFINKDVILWGHSIGGMIILTYFKNFKSEAERKVNGIILEHTTYTNPLKTSALSGILTAIQKPIIEPILYLHIYLWPYYKIKGWMNYMNGNLHISNVLTSFAGTQTRGMVDTTALYSALANPAINAKGVLGMLKYDVSKELKTIKTPTLVINASQDIITKPEAGQFINSQIPNSQLISVEPGGHMALFERNKEVSDAAERFLKSLNITTIKAVSDEPVLEDHI